MSRARAPAKINLALVVGARRSDGKHEVTTVLQRLELADEITLQTADLTVVEGFREDTLVAAALRLLTEATATSRQWRVRIEKRVPVAAGLGGGSSDAACALRMANETLERPLASEELLELATALGADVPFFLTNGPQIGEGDGSSLAPLDLPRDYSVVLILSKDAEKSSTGAVYDAFDARAGEARYVQRKEALRIALAHVRAARDLAALPPNDLASSELADELRALGAFRADVSGAGPTVYGLFETRAEAERAQAALGSHGRSWLTSPAW